jgi:hypothetical protein
MTDAEVEARIQQELNADDLTSYPGTLYQGYDAQEPPSEDLFLQRLRMDDEVPPMQDFSTPDAQIEARVQQQRSATPPPMTDAEVEARIQQEMMKSGPMLTDEQLMLEQFYRDALRRGN